MKRLYLTAATVAFTIALGACSPKADDQKTAATEPASAPAAMPVTPAAAPAASQMSKMDMPADAKMAKGTGTVAAVDAKAGTITLDHGPIPEANWPAMTMAFKASPAILSQVKPGDKVAFDLKLAGGAGEITAIQKP